MKRLLIIFFLLSSVCVIAQTSQPRYELITVSGTDTYTAMVAPTPVLVNGFSARFKFTNANSGASTFNLNSLGAVALRKPDGTALSAGDILAGSVWMLIYDGTASQWRLMGGSSAATEIEINSTPITGGTPGRLLLDNSGTVGELPLGGGVSSALTNGFGVSGGFVMYGDDGGMPSQIDLTNGYNLPQSGVTDLTSDLAGKQATLVSGTNIKTVNGNTLLGSGNLSISGGSSNPDNKFGYAFNEKPISGNYVDTSPAATITFTGDGVTFSGGVSNLLNYIEFDSLVSGASLWTMKATFVPTSDGDGISIGMQSLGSVPGKTFAKFVMTGVNKGKVQIGMQKSGGISTLATSPGVMSYTNSTDTLDLVFVRSVANYFAFVHNRATGADVPISNPGYQEPFNSTATFTIWQASKAAIFAMGGAQTVTHHSIYIDSPLNPDLLITGNSLLAGASAQDYTNTVDFKARSNMKSFVNLAGGSNTTAEMVALIPMAVKFKPKYLLITDGINDVALGTSMGTIQANINLVLDACRDSGITPILGTVVFVASGYPSAATINANVTTLNTWITTRGVRYIDFNTAMASGGNINPAYVDADNLHWNAAGNLQFYTTLDAAMKPLLSYEARPIVLPVSSGGTGSSSFTSSLLPYFNGTNFVSAGSNLTTSSALGWGGTGGIFDVRRSNAATNIQIGVIRHTAISTGTSANGHGPTEVFQIRSSSGNDVALGTFGFVMDAANSGRWVINNYLSGVATPTINGSSSGTVAIGKSTTTATDMLEVNGTISSGGNSTAAGQLKILEDTDNGSNFSSFTVGAQSANINYTLPTAVPTVTGQVITSTTAGVMSWSAYNVATGTGTLNFDLTSVNSQDLTITVTGAADGDPVSFSVPAASATANVQFTAWVSATNTVTVRAARIDVASGADPASGTFRASVIHY